MLYVIEERRMVADGDWYVAPSAAVIGSVRLGHEASIWFHCVVRGDCDWINIGAGSNVQDGTIIHTDTGFPTHIGANVSIGHRALLHSCTVGDNCLIANGAMVLDRVRIGRNCVIAAGALIPPDKEIPEGSVVMGSPGRIVRVVTERDLQMIARTAESYRQRAGTYRSSLVGDARG